VKVKKSRTARIAPEECNCCDTSFSAPSRSAYFLGSRDRFISY
jgi:hypothetical protein